MKQAWGGGSTFKLGNLSSCTSRVSKGRRGTTKAGKANTTISQFTTKGSMVNRLSTAATIRHTMTTVKHMLHNIWFNFPHTNHLPTNAREALLMAHTSILICSTSRRRLNLVSNYLSLLLLNMGGGTGLHGGESPHPPHIGKP